MKLLIITQKYDFNDSNLGAFIEWWDRLAEKVEKISILALERKSTPQKPNIKIISMSKEKGAGFFSKIIGFYSGLSKTIGDCDAILVHMIPKYVLLAAPVAFTYRRPIYLWYTGVSVHWQLRLAVFFCKKIFTAHEAAMRINTPKRIVTGHGINTERFRIYDLRFKNDGAITILSVGRITPSKGHDLIIRAVTDIIKLGHNPKLRIIGGVIQNYHENYNRSLKELACNLGIRDRIEFTGAVSYEKMPKYFNEAEILINAMPFGGLDKVVLEAMAAGVIPLTSNSAFLTVLPEAVARDLVFKPGDLNDLETKLKEIIIKELYKNKELKESLRNIVIRDHNLDSLIPIILKEITN